MEYEESQEHERRHEIIIRFAPVEARNENVAKVQEIVVRDGGVARPTMMNTMAGLRVSDEALKELQEIDDIRIERPETGYD